MDLSKHLEKAEQARKRRNLGLAVGLYQQILDLDPDCEEARRGLRAALADGARAGKGRGPLGIVQGFLPWISAKIALLTKNPAAAARNLERFLAIAPAQSGAQFELGLALERGGWLRSAYVVYRDLAERLGRAGRSSPEAGRACRAWRRAGAAARALKRLDEAMACYQAALDLDPRDQEALRARKDLAAEGALREGGFDRAASSLELLKNKEAQTRIERSRRLHVGREELEAELSRLEGELAGKPDDPDLLVEIGRLRARLGDAAGALDCLERALAARPGDAALEDEVGDLRLQELEERRRRAELLGDRGEVERLARELEGARLAELERRSKARPTDLGLRFRFGAALLEARRYEEATAELQKAVQDPKHRRRALLLLGWAFKAQGLPDLARSQWEKALAEGGGGADLDVLYELGLLAEEAGDAEAARAYFGRIVEVDISFKDVADRMKALGRT